MKESIDIKKSFGNCIYTFRKRKCITQEKLAEDLDISVLTVSRIENGRHWPRVSLMQKLVDYFGITPVECELYFKNAKFKG